MEGDAAPPRPGLREWVVGAVALPGTVLVFIPAALIALTRGTAWEADPAGPDAPELWIGLALAAAGVGLALWTGSLFHRFGRGTPAPWAPPGRFVVRGPYRHVRNPMITGVFLLLLAEALVLRSWAIGAWLLAFVALNAVYIPHVEERGLERRFGDEYRRYRGSVPRWIPRSRPWAPPETPGGTSGGDAS